MLFDHLPNTRASIEVSLNDCLPLDRDSLTQRRRLLQLQLDSIVYPVLTLPREITSEIFTACMPPADEATPFPTHPPILLLHVCRAWRHIALSTPAFWAALYLHIGRRDDAPERQGVMDLAYSWFSRACSLPIRLVLRGSRPLECDLTYRIVHQHAATLRHLTLRLDWIDFHKLPDLGPLPGLRTLTLGHVYGHDRRSRDVLTRAFYAAAPQLRDVTLERGIHPRMVSLPWRQLTTVVGDGFTVVECLRVLDDSPRLKKCRFTGINSGEDAPMVSHARLEDLCISPAIGELVGSLDLPMLRSLSLEGPVLLDPLFLEFLARSSASLRRFSYSRNFDYVDTPEILLDWFHAMDGLTAVVLEDVGASFAHRFLRALNRTVNESFLPQLRALTFVEPNHLVDTAVIDALRSRYSDADAVKLQALHLICDTTWAGGRENVGDVDWDSLSELPERGMDIHAGPEGRNLLLESRD
ncbi:hypothetical protein DFH09DRAFT_1357439 [Mycena vulgaris]|nr:hypothetical protein DFH09DRAFT_1357439 [Mycena vulgaris]